jgi:hypothetical protein
MFDPMAPSPPIVEHPNRDKPESKSTRAIVVALLVITAVASAIVLIGGWSRLSGAQPVSIGYIVIDLVLAFYIARWRSGLLPVAAALAIVLMIFALIGAPQWFDRDKSGLSSPLLDESIIGVVTLIIALLQVLLIAFSAKGFGQKWSVEVERNTDGSLRLAA